MAEWDLETDLSNVLKKNMQRLVNAVVSQLQDWGDSQTKDISNFDGNAGSFHATAQQIGQDSFEIGSEFTDDYIEFGTGIVGESSPHPDAMANGWDYDVNNHGTKGWWYGHGKHTWGIPAYAIGYRGWELLERYFNDIEKIDFLDENMPIPSLEGFGNYVQEMAMRESAFTEFENNAFQSENALRNMKTDTYSPDDTLDDIFGESSDYGELADIEKDGTY